MSSVQICKSGAFEEAAANNALVGMGDHGVSPGDAMRRSRNRVKCTPQERLRMRRERNRLHAKKTRDRKKWFLEASERTIADMEQEVQAMRNYLVSVKLMSALDVQKYKERDSLSKRQLALLKGTRPFKSTTTTTTTSIFISTSISTSISVTTFSSTHI